MIFSSWDIEQNTLKFVILGHFLPFIPLKPPKIKILKNQKICWRYISSFYTCAPKITIIWCTVPEILSERDKFFLSFWAILPFYLSHLIILNIKILKKMKKMSGNIIILLYIHGYHKWRSYDIWFLKYKAQQTEIFNILGHFLPFQPLDKKENQNFNTEKNTWRYYHFAPEMAIIWCMVPEIWSTTDMIFVILDHFLPFYPPMDPENQNFEKMKKTPEDIIILQT